MNAINLFNKWVESGKDEGMEKNHSFSVDYMLNLIPSDLLKSAFLAQNKSQSKYSNFSVGCALLTDDDQIIPGCNIESAAYPSTMCAERVAIYAAISFYFLCAGPGRLAIFQKKNKVTYYPKSSQS